MQWSYKMKTNELFAKMFAEPGFKIKKRQWKKEKYIYISAIDEICDEDDDWYDILPDDLQEDWEPYIKPPKKVKKTFYRAICLFKLVPIVTYLDFYPTKEKALEDITEDWKVINWEEREFEVEI